MKVLVTLSLVLFSLINSHAQQQKVNDYPIWIISKEVQKMQFRGQIYKPAVVMTGSERDFSQKEIHRLNFKAQPAARIRMTGTPDYVISKGVARMQMRKKAVQK